MRALKISHLATSFSVIRHICAMLNLAGGGGGTEKKTKKGEKHCGQSDVFKVLISAN